MTSVPGFLTKTFEIFSSPEYSDCCGWGANGETIIIRKIEQFSKQVLPKYFKHSNFQSFVRQLNMYDFHKTIQDPHHGEFVHEYFRQNKPELLVNIKRKANKPPEANSGKGKNVIKGSGSNASLGSGSRNNNNTKGQASKTSNANQSSNTSSALTQNNNNNNMALAPLPPPMSNLNLYHPNSLIQSTTNHPMIYGGGNLGQINNNTNNYPALPPSVPDSPVDLLPDLSFGSEGPFFVEEDSVNPGSGYLPQTAHPPSFYDPYVDPSYGQHLPENIATETGGVMQELQQQRLARENFERRMEQKLASLQGENNMLKRMFMESHHKNAVMQERMERVMKTLYTMFVNGSNGGNGNNALQSGNIPGMALTHRAPSMLITDMQHFLQQQKNSSDSEIELLEGMGVDTHAPRSSLMPLPLEGPSSSNIESMEYTNDNQSSQGRRGYNNNSNSSRNSAYSSNRNSSTTRNNRDTSTVGDNNTQVAEIGTYSSSGLQGGLGRPIVLGNGENELVSAPSLYFVNEPNNNDRLSAEDHRLLRLDSATLERLPSLDLDDLASISSEHNNNNSNSNNDSNSSTLAVELPTAAAASVGTTTSTRIGRKNSNSSTTSAAATTAPSTSTYTNNTINNNKTIPISHSQELPPAHYVHLLNRPMAGQALSDMKVTSFDIVAGAVTAPNLRQQSSFDGAYLPTPTDDFGLFSRNNTTNSIPNSIPNSISRSNSVGGVNTSAGLNTKLGVSGAPPGRVFLSPGDTKNTIGLGADSGIGGVAAGDSGVPSLPQPLLTRQRTFDPSHATTNHSSSDINGGINSGNAMDTTGEDSQAPKRKVESVSGGSNKKQKGNDNKEHDITEELTALEHEDVHSSLSEAQQFMDLLNRNQQTTLTRLDSLEQTIACLFDGPDGADTITNANTSNTSTNANDSSTNNSTNNDSDVTGGKEVTAGKGETSVLSAKKK